MLGLNFSHLTEKINEREKGIPRETELDIEEQLPKTKKVLDALTKDNTPWNKINEIKECRRGSGYESFNVMRDGINMYDACIEVQPKSKYIFREIYNKRNN